MAPYHVIVSPNVEKFLDKLDSVDRKKILKRFEKLAEDPFAVCERRGDFWLLKVGTSGFRFACWILENEKVVRVTNGEKRASHRYGSFYR